MMNRSTNIFLLNCNIKKKKELLEPENIALVNQVVPEERRGCDDDGKASVR
jgi:hypothetical protein